MKRKITAVLLCIALLLTLSLNVSAETAEQPQSTVDTQFTTAFDEITVTVGEDGVERVIQPVVEPIANDDGISTTATGAIPIGHLDTVNSSIIGGWAYQSDIPNTALTVHFYINNKSTGITVELLSTTANGYRPDLAAAGYGDGYHAFQYTMDWSDYPAGNYSVEAYAIGTHGVNPQLNSSPKTFTVRAPTGNIEYVDSAGIGGWAWKPDAPNNAIDVHIYIYNSSGAQVAFYPANANQRRSDLAAAGYGNGYHGFTQAIDWSSLPEERLRIVVYAVDGSGYNPSFYSGYYYNGVEEPTTDYIWPTVSKRITQIFKSGTHYGIDIGAVTAGVAGDPIYCFADGYVSRSEWSETYGYVVYVNHINPNPSISTYIQTKYAHMSSNLLVSANANITKGTQVGYMNTTGRSDAVHLHFETVMVSSMITVEMWANGAIDKSKCIDPLNYYDSSGNVLTYNIKGIGNNDNPWGLIFDINDIEIDTYDRISLIDIEQPINF